MNNDLKTLFSCPICLEILHNPITIICGHNFCKTCINTSVMSITKCPCCRVEIKDIQNYEINKQMKDIIEIYNSKLNKEKINPNERSMVFYEKIKGYCQNSSFKLKKRSISELYNVLPPIENNKISSIQIDLNYNNQITQDQSNHKSVSETLGDFEMFLTKFK